jgi:hypothetical protein
MKLMKLLSRIFHKNSKKDTEKDPLDGPSGSYYLMCTLVGILCTVKKACVATF